MTALLLATLRGRRKPRASPVSFGLRSPWHGAHVFPGIAMHRATIVRALHTSVPTIARRNGSPRREALLQSLATPTHVAKGRVLSSLGASLCLGTREHRAKVSAI